MKLFAAGFDTVILRYFLTMFVAIGAFMSGMPWLALLCLPTFLMAMLAIKVDYKEKAMVAQVQKNPYAKRHIEEAA